MKIALILINLVPLITVYVLSLGCVETDVLANNKLLNFQIAKPKYEEFKSTSGNNVTLRCVSPSRTIKWYFLPCGDINSNKPKNWTLVKSLQLHKSYEYVLHLKNVTENDSGYYKCSTYRNSNSIKLCKLTIKSKPRRTFTSVISSNHDLSYTEVKIKVGDSYTITCDNRNTNFIVALEFLPCVSNKNAICKFDNNVSEKVLFTPSSTTNVIKWKNNKIKMFNMKPNQSGLYRCTNNNKTYNIQVTNSRYDGPLPQILEVRRSRVSRDSEVLMKCIVYSEISPSINWLKESDETYHDLQYLDKFYQAVNRSETVPLNSHDYVYYGEIRVRILKDVENYVCLAMTQYGKDYEIIEIDSRNGNVDFSIRTISSLLFLIPLTFIIVPIIVWLCYLKKRSSSDLIQENDEAPSQIPLVRKLKAPW